VLASPLATLLGYHLSRITPLDDDLWLASLDARVAVVPIVIAGWGASLDRAWRVAVRAGLALQARWCLLFNGTHLRVLDAGRTFARRHIDFDLSGISIEPRGRWFCVHSAIVTRPHRVRIGRTWRARVRGAEAGCP
jgi:hypothetical protein